MRVLFVCSGNICRSPLGAQVLVARLGPDAPAFEVESAGTIADDGAPMDGAAAEQSRRLGGDAASHRSRYLTPEIVESADLVLTAERSHRAAVVSLAPRATKRAFTIKQFARVLDGLEPGDLAGVSTPEELVETVARLRGTVAPPADPADDDVDDPYRRSAATHARVADEIDAAVTVIADAMRAVR
ncbi:protein-tyrosine phosphatase [Curtobacterium luteum]|uniref:Low molecular weight phosphatase family protein n=1 Tax=Curtobacterium luteum TaxID=33881 RepID=A0A8H9G9I7_9MICO|nr:MULTISPECIES: low molecular weight phosphatase family protein [Curtobacterium]MBM7803880.1 protein-tyrosine phosphatase [Curtobacterium luteum]NUU51399.1 low molecular weight phosphatase family protein [Curtobacterium luteum]GGL04727.1 low molecular weight phosphatase family protein [Curtobacterium luteum]